MGNIYVSAFACHATGLDAVQAFGMPPSEIDAWISLTNDIQKVVIVDGHYSEPFQSICGAPEGDPLSVVASA